MAVKRRPRYDRIAGAGAVLIVLIICISAIIGAIARGGKDLDTKAKESSTPSQSSDPQQSQTFPTSVGAIEKVYKTLADITRGDLILVNSQHEFLFPAAGEEHTAVNLKANKTEHYYYALDSLRLNLNVIQSLNAWTNGYFAVNNTEDIRIVYAYTLDRIDPYDELSTGLAFVAGLRRDGSTYDKYKPEGKYAWFLENAHLYGFIQRYPAGKEDITLKKAENGHFRYVGVPHAVYMKQNNLVLEEYIEKVKEYTFVENRLNIEAPDGTKYSVYYVPASPTGETEISIDAAAINYTVSGNNIDGFIVAIQK